MDLDNVARKADVHAAWRRKLNNKFSYSKQFGKFSKTNVYIYYVSGTPEGRFCMFFVIRRAVLGQSWTPEGTLRARGPKSYKKLGKGRKNEGPRLLSGALWAPIDRSGEGLNRLADGLEVTPVSVSSILLNIC